jgi:dihydropyrimidinase
MHDLVIRNGTVVTPLSAQRLDVGVNGETIAALGQNLLGRRVIDASGMLVFPGVIDAHTHMDLPVAGMRSSDDFFTGTVAAAFGGVTSIIDFTIGSPHTSIPLDIERRLEDIRPAVIDVGLHAEVIGWKPEDPGQFADARRRGVTSFKFFTAYAASGRRTDAAVLRRAFEHLADLDCVAVVHCEDEELIRSIMESLSPEQLGDMSTLARARPDLCESAAISQVGRVASETGCRTHIVHVSSAKGLAAVQEARKAGATMSAETCPQYLVLAADSYDRMDGYLFSAAPALRTLADQSALWRGLRDRALDFVATDHCPFTREQKAWRGSFVDLPYGLPGVETLLPILYSEGVGKGLLTVTDIPRLLSEGPARIYGLDDRKGAIEVGLDADLVLFDPVVEWELDASFLHMRTDFSPYEGWAVTGKPMWTIARGEVIVQDEEFVAEEGRGKFLFRHRP